MFFGIRSNGPLGKDFLADKDKLDRLADPSSRLGKRSTFWSSFISSFRHGRLNLADTHGLVASSELPLFIKKSDVKIGKGAFASKSIFEIRLSDRGPTIASVFCKTLRQPKNPNRLYSRWLNEALFYKEIRGHVDLSCLVVPDFFGVHVADNSTVNLYIERLNGFSPHKKAEDSLLIVRGLAELAAKTTSIPSQFEWLPINSGIVRDESIGEIQKLLSLLTLADKELAGLVNLFKSFLDLRPQVRKLYESFVPALAHNDCVTSNIMIDRDGGRVAAVDWARVSSGRIGDDLGRVMPWILRKILAVQGEHQMMEAEDRLVAEYIRTVISLKNGLSSQAIQEAYELASINYLLRLSGKYAAQIEASEETMKSQAIEQMKDYCSLIAVRTANLIRRVAGKSAAPNGFLQDRLTAKYLGEGAKQYNARRSGDPRWQREHEIVRGMLGRYQGKSVLDLPVGTGRFISIYKDFSCPWVGVDLSPDMIEEAKAESARTEYPPQILKVADATMGHIQGINCDVAVAIRFLNWLNPDKAKSAMCALGAMSREAMIVSLNSLDIEQVELGERQKTLAAIAKRRSQPRKDGQPINAVHLWQEFVSWIEAAGFEIAQSEIVARSENGKNVNQIHLLRRAVEVQNAR